jgi:hypothetical protein
MSVIQKLRIDKSDTDTLFHKKIIALISLKKLHRFKIRHFKATSDCLASKTREKIDRYNQKIGVGISGSDSRNFAHPWYQLMEAGRGGDAGVGVLLFMCDSGDSFFCVQQFNNWSTKPTTPLGRTKMICTILFFHSILSQD